MITYILLGSGLLLVLFLLLVVNLDKLVKVNTAVITAVGKDSTVEYISIPDLDSKSIEIMYYRNKQYTLERYTLKGPSRFIPKYLLAIMIVYVMHRFIINVFTTVVVKTKPTTLHSSSVPELIPVMQAKIK